MKPILTKNDKARLTTAIEEAEKETSGEIVVAVRKHVRGDVYEAAKKFFARKKLERTKDRNAVLIFLIWKDRQLAVLGDTGINAVVPDDFWNGIITTMTTRFKEEDYIGGLEAGILELGKQLQQFFPYQEDDVNELSDEVYLE